MVNRAVLVDQAAQAVQADLEDLVDLVAHVSF